MRTVIFLALLALTVSATSSCVTNKAGSAISEISTMVKTKTTIENFDQLETAVAQLKTIRSAFQECGQNANDASAVSRIVTNLGIGNMLLSECSKDIGTFFLILDSVIENPKDIMGDIFALIFENLMGKQSIADCGQFIAFLQSLRH